MNHIRTTYACSIQQFCKAKVSWLALIPPRSVCMPLQYNGTVQLGNVHHSPRAQIRVKIAKAFHLKFKSDSGAGGGRVGEART